MRPGARRPRIDLADLRSETWIAGCREHLVQLCHGAGFEPQIAFVSDDTVAVQSMVAAGLGVALLPRLILDFVHMAGTRALRLIGSPARTISAVATTSGAQLPAVAALLNALELAAFRSPSGASGRGHRVRPFSVVNANLAGADQAERLIRNPSSSPRP